MENVHPFPHQQVDERVPEFVEAELYVLGDCIHDAHHVPRLRLVLQRSDFYRPSHEVIWDVLGELYDAGQPTDPANLRKTLERKKLLGRAGGPNFVADLANYVSGDPLFYAERIRAAAELRAEAELGRRIVQQATAPDAEPGRAVTFIDDYLQRQKERLAGRSGDPVDALLAELLDASSLDNMPTLEPLIGDMLHLDSLARVVGPSGHMKSFAVIDMAGHVGTGLKWHGQYVRQGTVVYLVAEGARGIRKRVRAWEKHYGLKMDNVLFLPRPVQAMSPEWDTLIEAMRRLEPALIVVDTQARVSVGVEENSAKELGLVVDRLEQLRAATAACVLLVHHTGHVGEHGRGSSSAKGALQSELHVSKKGDNASNIIVTIKTGKQKDDEEGNDLQFALKVVTIDGEFKADGRPVTSVVLESLDTRPRPVEAGSPEWLVAVLDKADIPLTWGSPKVISWCADAGIQMRKSKVEEAVRFRKTRNTFEDPRNGANWVPPNLPRDLESPPSRDLGGRRGEFDQNTRSNLPPNPGGGRGEAPTAPPSPRPSSREGGGAGDHPQTATPEPPLCTICNRPINTEWADRGYDTHLGCDPTTGSHPDAA
ncbi:AAA family ATPase [Streptomyces sp. NPDC006544]|uniref:AAA family ATPase n=1 Tax=Streptomyces sp. NPDC006544 TaxID=3154583 RepID=UPI0033AA4E0E